jgi:hypothetical protein
MHPDRQIPVLFSDENEHDGKTFLPLWRCQQYRCLGYGRWINHIFKLKKSAEIERYQVGKPQKPKVNAEDGDMRGSSAMVSPAVIEAFCRGEQWALEAVRAWRQDVAQWRHRSSLKRVQTPVAKRTSAEGSPA